MAQIMSDREVPITLTGFMGLIGLTAMFADNPVMAQTASEPVAQACEDRITVEANGNIAVRITIDNPCRAGSIVRFEHNGEALTRFADDAGRISFFRLLGNGDNRISLNDGDNSIPLYGDDAAPETTVDQATSPALDDTPADTAETDTPIPTEASSEPAQETTRDCGDVTTETQFDGPLLTVTLASPCDETKTVRVDYRERGWSYYGSLNAQTPLTFSLIAIDPVITLDLGIENGGYQSIELQRPIEADNQALALLIWDAPIDLDLVAREPTDGAVQALDDDAASLGRMLLLDDGNHSGTKMEAYMIDPIKLRDSTGLARPVIGLSVRNVTRGLEPEGEHCGDGQYAAIRYSLMWQAENRVRERRFSLRPSICGSTLSDANYLIHSADLRP